MRVWQDGYYEAETSAILAIASSFSYLIKAFHMISSYSLTNRSRYTNEVGFFVSAKISPIFGYTKESAADHYTLNFLKNAFAFLIFKGGPDLT